MNRLYRIFLALVLLFGTFAAWAGEGPDCFTVIAGRAATADGAVLLAHNEDDHSPQIVNWIKVRTSPKKSLREQRTP
jgi:hypothetical protein